jgi:hypothetical protein
LSNPAEAANIMGFKDGSISQMLMDAFTDPESDLLKELLGTKKDDKESKGGGPQGNRFAPNSGRRDLLRARARVLKTGDRRSPHCCQPSVD